MKVIVVDKKKTKNKGGEIGWAWVGVGWGEGEGRRSTRVKEIEELGMSIGNELMGQRPSVDVFYFLLDF